MVKNDFQCYIICLYLESFAKSHIFWEKTMENVSLTMPHFASRLNRDSKSRTETTPRLVSAPWIQWQFQIWEMSCRWKSNFLRQAQLSRFTWMLNNMISGVLFRKPSIPQDLCWRIGFNYELKPLFWLTDRNLTFWMILLLGSKIWDWSLEVAVKLTLWFLKIKNSFCKTKVVNLF